MELKSYKLVDIVTNKVIETVQLTHEERLILNYAFALNRTTFKFVIDN
jgi:hypothetical protein